MSVVMYEFIAPWGVLVPVFSATICYFLSASARRKALLEEFEVATRVEDTSSRVVLSHLSV